MCDGLVKYRAALHAGTIPVESMRGNPLDMHQFLRVFGMTRVPKEGQDELVQDAAMSPEEQQPVKAAKKGSLGRGASGPPRGRSATW